MHVLTQFGADLRPLHRSIAVVLLGVLLCSPTTVVGEDANHDQVVQHSERFAFTGSYRFWLTPTAKSQTGPKLGSDSRQTDRSRPARHEATTQPPTEDSKAGIASVGNGSIARAPQTKPNTRNRARLSRETRSSLGVTPNGQPKADAITEPAQTRLPVFRAAISSAATSSNADEPQAITLAPTGRIINVPPLPARYRRPASASRTRNNGFASKPKRIVKRAVKQKAAPLSAKSVKPKPYSVYASQPDWANNALFETDQ